MISNVPNSQGKVAIRRWCGEKYLSSVMHKSFLIATVKG